jgi:hypothetical protein
MAARRESSSLRLVVARAVRLSTTVRMEDGVVGEAGEGVGGFVDVDFGFVGAGGFGEAENGVDDAAQLVFGEQLGGRCRALPC